MNPHDAQSSLDAIRQLQDRSREEVVRHSFARPYVLLAALGLFVMLASTDLQRPWSLAAILLGFGLYVGVGLVRERWASVQRKPSGLEVLFYLGLSAGLMLLFGIFRIVAWALFSVPAHGLWSQGTLAAAAAALMYVAITPLARRGFRVIMRRDSGRG
jgi:cation transport ATPase